MRKKCVCGMNVYECVCESVSEWNECDMNVHECVYECVCVCGMCTCVTRRPMAISL